MCDSIEGGLNSTLHLIYLYCFPVGFSYEIFSWLLKRFFSWINTSNMLLWLSKVHALSHNSDRPQENMVRLITGSAVHPNICTPKYWVLNLHTPHPPTYIEMMAKGSWMKILPSCLPPRLELSAELRWHLGSVWTLGNVCCDLVLKSETAVTQLTAMLSSS